MRIAVPLENHTDAQYESMRARVPTIPTMAKVTLTPALFAKKPLEVVPVVGSGDTVDIEPAVFGRKLGPVLVLPRPVILPGW